jgi:hypothetical protein
MDPKYESNYTSLTSRLPLEEILVCILYANDLHTKYCSRIIKISLQFNSSAGHFENKCHINVSVDG